MFPQIYKDLYEDAMLESIQMGSNIAAGNQQKHLSLSFAKKSMSLSHEELKNISNTWTVQIANFPEICHFLTNMTALSAVM